MKNRKWLLWTVLMAAAVTVYAQQYDAESDFKITLLDGGKSIEITEYVGSKLTVRIPPMIQGLPVTSIGNYAFSRCTSLTSVTIPNSVITIGDRTFVSWFNSTAITAITAINVAVDNSAYTAEDGVLYNKNKSTLIAYPKRKKGSFTIPNSVTSIGTYAFFGCDSLTSVIIGNSVTSIGDYAFYECRNLTSVTIPNSVTSIGGGAFFKCTRLASITIPNSVKSIGGGAFSDCTRLTNVTFQGTISSSDFNSNAFDGDLHDKFYAGNANGTPGRYMRANGTATTWTKQ